MQTPLIQAQNLSVTFATPPLPFRAVDDVSFSIETGQTYCLVGESGCGKSLTAKAILGLIPPPGTATGKIFFAGRDLLTLRERDLQSVRGNDISMIFQEPMTALNPVLKVGLQAAEPLRLHRDLSADAARRRILELFEQVGIAAPQSRLDDYPHQLSGGMRQRVMIAMALACEPQLLLADEPTTALDVTIQGQILDLIRSITARRGMSVLLITHDLGVVAQMADMVSVMYAGHMVETAPLDELLKHPLHPYTQGLIHAAPTRENMLQDRLPTIAGTVPHPAAMPQGCRFHPRCPHVAPRCRQTCPPAMGTTHRVRCWLYR